MVALSVLIYIFISHRLTGDFRNQGESFKDRHRVRAAAAQVINLTHSWSFDEAPDKLQYIIAVNIIPNLLPLITEDAIDTVFKVTFDKVTYKPMQFHTAVVRSRKATAP